jgi:signal transduction histidine kinase
MKREKDKRVTAGVSLKDCAAIFGALSVISGLHMVIFITIQNEDRASPIFIINALIGWLLFSSGVLTAIYGLIRRFLLERPMRHFSEAAKQIAAGDFSVRVKSLPGKKNNKKDYLDVMVDDFNTMAAELAGIETLKNDFISNVSHEIKTPISVIYNYTKALRNDALTPEERQEYTETIMDSAQKLSALVTNILKLNKLENQEIVPEAAFYDLGEQLRRCALAFEDQWEARGITFSGDFDKIVVCYNETMLELVWNNLISNALKFTERGGCIALSLKAVDGFAVVTVRDSGCGMDAETRKHIFDKFYQGDTSHSQEGNGLGLALVMRVIQNLGGAITVESEPGKGSTFTVRLKM